MQSEIGEKFIQDGSTQFGWNTEATIGQNRMTVSRFIDYLKDQFGIVIDEWSQVTGGEVSRFFRRNVEPEKPLTDQEVKLSIAEIQERGRTHRIIVMVVGAFAALWLFLEFISSFFR